MVSLNFQYNSQEEQSEDIYTLTANFIDGRGIMTIRFFDPGKIESFYLQFQSSLCNQGYNFQQRLKYSELCNSFISQDESTQAYMLKKQNYFIALIK